jgi:citrate lyase subunit beta/citryl-CoA lyase
LGFGAKLCIHPKQLEAVEAAFSPDADTRAWAERVVLAWQGAEEAGAGVGALMVDGKMVDKPVLLRAQRVLGL